MSSGRPGAVGGLKVCVRVYLDALSLRKEIKKLKGPEERYLWALVWWRRSSLALLKVMEDSSCFDFIASGS